MATRSIRLEPVTALDGRPVSAIEYYHACVGASRRTLEASREVVIVLEGDTAGFDSGGWQAALAAAVQANPGAAVRMAGSLICSHWRAGVPPPLRRVPGCDWDGRSDAGSDFLYATSLDVRTGPVAELILVEGAPAFVILRALHCAMDGLGMVFFLQELFRALRGEPLAGTSSRASDVDIARAVVAGSRPDLRGRPPPATGGPRGAQRGDCWRRLDIAGPSGAVLPKVMLAMARMAQAHADAPARMAVPVSLRRHVAGLTSTMNCTGMAYVSVDRGDDIRTVRAKLDAVLAANEHTWLPPLLPMLKLLPLRLLDRLLLRTERNYRRRRIFETAVVSNLGRFRSADFIGAGFRARRLFTVPVRGNTMTMFASLDDTLSISIGTERIYATDGRLDQLVDSVRREFEGSPPDVSG